MRNSITAFIHRLILLLLIGMPLFFFIKFSSYFKVNNNNNRYYEGQSKSSNPYTKREDHYKFTRNMYCHK